MPFNIKNIQTSQNRRFSRINWIGKENACDEKKTIQSTAHFKRGNFIGCELYLNEKRKKKETDRSSCASPLEPPSLKPALLFPLSLFCPCGIMYYCHGLWIPHAPHWSLGIGNWTWLSKSPFHWLWVLPFSSASSSSFLGRDGILIPWSFDY